MKTLPVLVWLPSPFSIFFWKKTHKRKCKQINKQANKHKLTCTYLNIQHTQGPIEWIMHRNIWVKVFKNGPSKICGRKPLKNYLVHSWIPWPIYKQNLPCTLSCYLHYFDLPTYIEDLPSSVGLQCNSYSKKYYFAELTYQNSHDWTKLSPSCETQRRLIEIV